MALRPSPELAGATERLYAAFQHYPLPAATHPCPCCHSVDSERALYSRPLRKLKPEDLEQYAMDALLVWGGVDEFRHFLPRIFEIAASSEPFSFADREIVFSRLYYGEWRTWPQAEQDAVQAFLLALWRAALAEPPSNDLCSAPEVESWLCALARTGGDLSPYLSEWLKSSSFSYSAARNLAAMIYRTGMPQSRPRGISAFWANHMDQAKQVSEWLHNEAVRNALEKAALTYANEPFGEELLAAAGVVSK